MANLTKKSYKFRNLFIDLREVVKLNGVYFLFEYCNRREFFPVVPDSPSYLFLGSLSL